MHHSHPHTSAVSKLALPASTESIGRSDTTVMLWEVTAKEMAGSLTGRWRRKYAGKTGLSGLDTLAAETIVSSERYPAFYGGIGHGPQTPHPCTSVHEMQG